MLMHMTRPVEWSLPKRGEKGTDGWSVPKNSLRVQNFLFSEPMTQG